jgi:hypothetical protein
LDDMNTVSPLLDARSRKTFSILLQSIARVGQIRVATALGVSEATVSRMVSNDFERIALALTAMGLKPVPVDAKCYTPEHITSLQYFAKRGMGGQEPEDTGLHWG